MIDISDRYPETSEGIAKAIRKAGPDGDWAGLVNWWGDSSDVMSKRLRVAEALRCGADVSPDLVAEVGIETASNISCVGATAISGMRNEEGHYDVPSIVVVPDSIRAHLPA